MYTLFAMDTTDVAASYAGGLSNTAESVNEFLSSEVVPLADLRERRKKLAEAQGRADSIKAAVCEKVTSEISAPLHERIMKLRETDPEMYDLVWHLRSLKYGIWCTQCEQVKQFGGRPAEDVRRDVEADARGENPELHATKKHIPLTRGNSTLPLLTQKEQQKIAQRTATTRAAITNGEHRRGVGDSAAGDGGDGTSQRKALPAAPARAASVTPAQKAAPTAAIDAAGLDQRIAALTKLRDQIGEQLGHVDSFIGSLREMQTPAPAPAPAPASAPATETVEEKRNTIDDAEDQYATDDAAVDAVNSTDINAMLDSVIANAIIENVGDEYNF